MPYNSNNKSKFFLSLNTFKIIDLIVLGKLSFQSKSAVNLDFLGVEVKAAEKKCYITFHHYASIRISFYLYI